MKKTTNQSFKQAGKQFVEEFEFFLKSFPKDCNFMFSAPRPDDDILPTYMSSLDLPGMSITFKLMCHREGKVKTELEFWGTFEAKSKNTDHEAFKKPVRPSGLS